MSILSAPHAKLLLNLLNLKGYFDSTNEPSQQMPFMYHYANRPGLSTERSRETIAKSFTTRADGLPGNDGTCTSLSLNAITLTYNRSDKQSNPDSDAMASFIVVPHVWPLPAVSHARVLHFVAVLPDGADLEPIIRDYDYDYDYDYDSY